MPFHLESYMHSRVLISLAVLIPLRFAQAEEAANPTGEVAIHIDPAWWEENCQIELNGLQMAERSTGRAEHDQTILLKRSCKVTQDDFTVSFSSPSLGQSSLYVPSPEHLQRHQSQSHLKQLAAQISTSRAPAEAKSADPLRLGLDFGSSWVSLHKDSSVQTARKWTCSATLEYEAKLLFALEGSWKNLREGDPDSWIIGLHAPLVLPTSSANRKDIGPSLRLGIAHAFAKSSQRDQVAPMRGWEVSLWPVLQIPLGKFVGRLGLKYSQSLDQFGSTRTNALIGLSW